MSSIAYQVSYTTEYRYRDGRIESNDAHTRFFATRDRAVVHAMYITGAKTERNGRFVSEWTTPFASIIEPEDQEEIRVTAIVETVTISEIEATL